MKELTNRGHHVTVVRGDKYVGNASINNCELISLDISYSSRYSLARRLISFYRYYFKGYKVVKNLMKNRQYDLVYATSTPITVGLLALKIRKKKGLPYIFEVRDLWPEVVFELLRIKKSYIRRIIERKAHRIYSNAEAVVTVAPTMEPHNRPYTSKKIKLIPNFSNLELFSGSKEKRSRFRIGYFGAVGKVNNPEFLKRFIHHTANLNVEIHIIGWGNRFDQLRTYAMNYPHVTISGKISKEEIAREFVSADAILISFLSGRYMEMVSPNKFFDALASSSPVIINMQGWLKDLVESEGCGIHVSNQLEESDIMKIQKLVSDKSYHATLSENARNTAQQFSMTRLTREACDFIEDIMAYRTTPA